MLEQIVSISFFGGDTWSPGYKPITPNLFLSKSLGWQIRSGKSRTWIGALPWSTFFKDQCILEKLEGISCIKYSVHMSSSKWSAIWRLFSTPQASFPRTFLSRWEQAHCGMQCFGGKTRCYGATRVSTFTSPAWTPRQSPRPRWTSEKEDVSRSLEVSFPSIRDCAFAHFELMRTEQPLMCWERSGWRFRKRSEGQLWLQPSACACCV